MRPSVDKKSWIPGILNLPNQRAYAKMPSLVHQMPSLAKCISQMANCWRAIFMVFGKFLECITQMVWRCSKQALEHSKRTPQIVSSLSAAAATSALLPSGANALILPFSNLDSPPSRASFPSSRLPAGRCAACTERGWRPGRVGRT